MSYVQVESVPNLGQQPSETPSKETLLANPSEMLDATPTAGSVRLGRFEPYGEAPKPSRETMICGLHWYKFCWVIFLLYCVCGVAYFATLPNKTEPLRCIRIHYDAATGQYECINWDLQPVPLVGARELVAIESSCPRNTRLFIDGAGKYAVVVNRDGPVQVTYPSSGDRQYRTSLECKTDGIVGYAPLDILLEDIIIFASAGKHVPALNFDVDTALRMCPMNRLLYYALLSGAKLPAFTCRKQEYVLQSFQIRKTYSHPKYVVESNGWFMHPSDVSFAKSHRDVPRWHKTHVSGILLSLRLEFLSETEFELKIEMLPAKYCDGTNVDRQKF